MAEILIYGVIGVDVTAADVKAQLAEADGETVVARIDSPGGSVFQGLSIFQAFSEYAGPKSAVIESAAFSIASYIVMAFDDVEIAANGYLMLHDPRKMPSQALTAKAFDREAKAMSKLRDSMIQAYAQRTGKSESAIAAMLDEDEVYLNAEESLSQGFVSRVSDSKVSTRVIGFSDSMPEGVYAQLRGTKGDTQETRRDPVSEKTEPVAASVAEIEKAFPQAKADFILRCVKQSMPIASVAGEYANDLQKQNSELNEQIAELKSELEEAKAKAEESQGEAVQATQAAASAVSNDPVAQGDGDVQASAADRWNAAVSQYTDKGLPKTKAIQLANRNNPGLRTAMVAEANA